MFDSLDDQIKADMKKESSNKERMLIYAAIAVTSVLVFGGLFFGTYLFS
jgi:hypothetical protein